MQQFVAQSISVIKAGQAENGAYIACPNFPTYHYCWFRDGTFIAYAMDMWQEYASAERFYNWTAETILARREAVGRCVEAASKGLQPDPADLLHTRYKLNGEPGSEDWPNFQLDGFGTLLWGYQRHAQLSAQKALPASWAGAAELLVRYLAALWNRPNYDCWEEFPDQIAVSTLAALYAGLHATSTAPVNAATAELAAQTAAQIKQFVLARGVCDGHLIKQIDGQDAVDASLLWACAPFGADGLLHPTEPLMQATAARIEADLVGATGGVHRYRADTYYGGGEWMLLTAVLGSYRLASGNAEGARQALHYLEQHFDAHGYLPEQISDATLRPDYIAQWVERWGPIASPLLWSHATYLVLNKELLH